jgi:hypothetical protein
MQHQISLKVGLTEKVVPKIDEGWHLLNYTVYHNFWVSDVLALIYPLLAVVNS